MRRTWWPWPIAALAWWPWPLKSQVFRQSRNNGLVVYGHGIAVGLSALDPAIVLGHWVICVSRLIVRAHAVHVQVPGAARASRVVNARIEGGTAVDACPFPPRTVHSCGQRPSACGPRSDGFPAQSLGTPSGITGSLLAERPCLSSQRRREIRDVCGLDHRLCQRALQGGWACGRRQQWWWHQSYLSENGIGSGRGRRRR